MTYIVNASNGNVLMEIADRTINSTDSSLDIPGRGTRNIGEMFAENFIHLLENFADIGPPRSPLTGQVWFNTSDATLNLYNGLQWKPLNGHEATDIGAGSVGVALTSTLSVTVFLANNSIISVISHEAIPQNLLPPSLLANSASFPFRVRFPNGLQAGITLATDSVGYIFSGTASSALYADLAERYETSEIVGPGDVVDLGGPSEIRLSKSRKSSDVFGVISTNPAFRMNEGAGNQDTWPYVALVGRVPCKVVGKVDKFARLMSSDIPGVAMAADIDCNPFHIIGRSLNNKTYDEVGIIEVVVGTK